MVNFYPWFINCSKTANLDQVAGNCSVCVQVCMCVLVYIITRIYVLSSYTVVLEIFEVKLISCSTAITKINITTFLLLRILACAACKHKHKKKRHKNNFVIEKFSTK